MSTTTTTEPALQIPPNPYHRKIDLQSPHDLSYLQSNLLKSAHDKLDLHFPPSALASAAPATIIPLGGSHPATTTQPQEASSTAPPLDPLREKVKDLVTSFVHRTYEGANLNISVNGLDASSLALPHGRSEGTEDTSRNATREVEGRDFTYANYDAKLQEKVAKLYSEVEMLTAQVSRLRREAPRTGAMGFAEALEGVVRVDDERWEGERKRKRGSGEDAVGGDDEEGQERLLELKSVRDGWSEDVRRVYGIGEAELRRLVGRMQDEKGGSLTETTGRVQRARQVAMEFE